MDYSRLARCLRASDRFPAVVAEENKRTGRDREMPRIYVSGPPQYTPDYMGSMQSMVPAMSSLGRGIGSLIQARKLKDEKKKQETEAIKRNSAMISALESRKPEWKDDGTIDLMREHPDLAESAFRSILADELKGKAEEFTGPRTMDQVGADEYNQWRQDNPNASDAEVEAKIRKMRGYQAPEVKPGKSEEEKMIEDIENLVDVRSRLDADTTPGAARAFDGMISEKASMLNTMRMQRNAKAAAVRINDFIQNTPIMRAFAESLAGKGKRNEGNGRDGQDGQDGQGKKRAGRPRSQEGTKAKATGLSEEEQKKFIEAVF